MPLPCNSGEDSWEFLGQQRDQNSLKGNQLNTHWKDCCWNWSPTIWSSDENSRLVGKDPDAGKDWGQEEKTVAKDEMVGWHHWPDGHEFEETPGDGEGQRSLVCCGPWGHKELDTTEWLNSNKRLNYNEAATEGSASPRAALELGWPFSEVPLWGGAAGPLSPPLAVPSASDFLQGGVMSLGGGQSWTDLAVS